ncbi:Glyoxalase/Bleomycin resistance protein/Dioxygenase superfamily protein [compost metagenome]
MTISNVSTDTRPGRGLAALGPVMQMAFVPVDFDAALKFWTQTMGAGPFFLMEHIQAENMQYRGMPADIDFTAAMGYWGDMQIELIKQHNSTPSIFADWQSKGLDGLHHICIAVDDMEHALAVCAAAGCEVLQRAQFRGGNAEVVYVDTHGGPGSIVELWKGDDAGRAFFAGLRQAAQNWDGSDPIRRRG